MKKLITLLIVLICCVGTVGAKTIYFVNNWGRTNLQLYAWTGGSNNGWVSLTVPTSYIGKSDGWLNCYALDLGDYENFLIKHDSYDDREQTPDLSSSDFTDGGYYEYYYDSGSSSEKLQAATLYTYTFNVTTANSWSNFYIHIWNTDNQNSISGAPWPGRPVTGSENVYSYTFKSYINTVGIIFNQGDSKPKTCDLTPAEGTNNYYISTVSNDGGQSIKTNASGYATAVSAGNLNMTSGIAYVAEDNGNGSATAHTITGIGYEKPFIISGEANTTYHFGWAAAETELPCTNAFCKGSGVALGANDGGGVNYILKGDTFYKANGNVVATNKAYLKLSREASARALIFPGDDDETTAIENMKATTVDSNAPIYNIAGQRVAKDYRGIVIQNGRKFINK